MHIVGLDIGGAHLKAAGTDGHATTRAYPIWEDPARLAMELGILLGQLPIADGLSVTMTAELADCFETKRDGVLAILDAVEQVADGRTVAVWQTGGEFVSISDARDLPRLVAAANWHALATFAGRLAPTGEALLIDIGSTTTDLVPILNGQPIPWGLTDRQRLESRELVYTGVGRTPLCSLAPAVTLGDRGIGLAAELFATTLDIYLLTGDIPETDVADAGTDTPTADGRSAICADARRRLCRMICSDETEVTDSEIEELALALAGIQHDIILKAVDRVIGRSEAGPPLDAVLVSGSGAFLARRVVAAHPDLAGAATQVDLTDCFSADVATAACAYAMARLAAERVPEFQSD